MLNPIDSEGPREGIALRPLLLLGASVALVLIVFAGGYGYHRDELYFLVCGEHLSWGFADQGPLTPFIAKAMNAIAPGSLTLLRTPSALMMGGTVVLTGAPAPAVIFTSNYGEAGAIDRFGPELRLPAAYSGHNAFAEWGPPPDRPAPVVVVGLSGPELAAHFAGCRLAARVDNAAGIDNDESGTPVELCAGTRRPWSRMWSGLRHLN